MGASREFTRSVPRADTCIGSEIAGVRAPRGIDIGIAEIDAKIVDLTIDCIDPERIAVFWSALLGRSVEGRKGPYVWLQRPERGIGLGFQRVSERKLTKNRVHFDISAPDIRRLEERVVELGGQRVELYDGGFLVMADPEGNEFCIVPIEPIHFDDDGPTGYLHEL